MENVHETKDIRGTNYPDSEDTEIYELEEKIIGTITFINKMEETLPLNANTTKNTRKPIKRECSLVHHKRNKNLNFKCSATNCQTRAETRKEIDLHYKTLHVSKNYCKLCTKKYSTPYGLKQHLYMHRTTSQATGHTCGRCKKIFPFLSQLKIHRLSHTKKQRYECDECFTSYKFKHDMQWHKREHNLTIVQCDYCDYTGSKLLLREHVKQHNPNYYICCHTCNKKFKFRMSY